MARIGETDPRWIVEDRTDGTNVNNWHWTEKNCMPWAKQRLEQLLTDVVLHESDSDKITITKVDHVKGEANINTRKGKVFHFYELDLKLNWAGEIKGEKVEGSIQFPEISFEYQPNEYEVNIKCTKGKASNVRSAVEAALPQIRERLQQFLDDFYAQKGELRESKSKPLSPATQQQRAEERAKIAMDIDEQTSTSSRASSSSSSLELVVNFRAQSGDIWEALMDPRRVSAYTQSEAKIDASPNGKFSLLGGRITGEFKEFDQGNKIVESWRLASWPEGHYSRVELTFKSSGGGVKLKLKQTNVPEDDVGPVRALWMENFFERIKVMFGYGFTLGGF